MPGSEILVISKRTLLESWHWARRVQPGATGCAFVGSVSWDLTIGRAVQLGVGCGSCRNCQHCKNCVSLSSCRKTNLKKLINVSYLNYGESSVFRDFSASEYFTYSYFGYATIAFYTIPDFILFIWLGQIYPKASFEEPSES